VRATTTINPSTTAPKVAYEWQIDLANRLNRDMWVCVPTVADTDFAYQWATLIHSQLNGGLRVWVEYSNELWNFDATYVQQQGAVLGLPGSTAEAKGYSFTAYKAVRAFEQFEKVFGKDSPRLVKVLCGNAANRFVERGMRSSMADTLKVNPHKVKANVFGIAPYFGGATIAAMRSNINTGVKTGVATHKEVTNQGLQLVCYEAGMDASLGDLSGDPQIYDVYKEYLDTLVKYGVNGTINQYTAVGQGWGAKQTTGQALAQAHKHRAIMDWITAHPVSIDRQEGPRTCLTPTMAPQIVRTPAVVTIRLGSTPIESARLLRMDGTVLQSRHDLTGEATFPMAGYGSGVYLLRLYGDGSTQTHTLMLR
jgi:hypothetical protein